MRTNSRLRLTRDVPGLFVVVAFYWLGFGISPTYGQDLFWTLPESGVPANDGNWFTPDNWSSNPPPQIVQGTPGPPTAAQSASVGNAPSANITAPGAVANELLIGGAIVSGVTAGTTAAVTSDPVVPSGTGQVIVSGGTASLTLFGTALPVGQVSLDVVSGSLLVENGATLTSSGSGVGRFADAETPATVNVMGSGSTWIENGTLVIGLANESTVTVSDGASFRGAGTVTIASGTLEIGTGNLSGTFNAPSIVNNGVIAFNFTDTTTLSAQVSGTGNIEKFGSGTLTLTGANSYSGLTDVEGGTVVAAATKALGTGDVDVSGPTSVLRISPGTLEANFFSVSAGATLDNAGVLQHPLATDDFTSLITVTGDGTITNEVTGSIIATSTSPELIAIEATPAAEDPVTVTNAGVISGVIAISFTDVDGTITNASTGTIIGTGGKGGAFAAIEATGGTVTLSNAGVIHGNVTLDDFPNTVTLFTGSQIVGNLNLGSPTAASLILVGSGTQLLSQAVTGTVSNFNTLTKQGTGTWTVDEALTYTGGTTISAGILQLGNGGTIGSIIGNVTDDGTLAFDRSDSATFAGVISGAGAVSQNGPGTITPTATNTYSGGTNLNAGILAVASDSNLGTGALSFNGGSLEALAAGGGITSSKAITLNAGGGTFLADARTASTLSGAITGTGAWTKTGPGTLTLTGVNTYTGGTTISAGTLQLGNGGTTGSITGNVANNGVLAFDHSDALSFAGDISGSGSITQVGTGTTILTGNNTYTGGTTISAGTLQIGNGGTTGSIDGAVVDNGVLAFDRSDSVTFSGVISGTGSLVKLGAGAVTLPNTNTYTGTTTVNSGSLIVNGSIASAETVVNSGGFLGGHGTIGGNLVNNGVVGQVNSPGTLTVVGNYIQSAGGTLRIEVAGLTASEHDLLAVNGHASLAGTLQLIGLGGFTLHVGDQVTFLTANGGVSGSFGTVPNELATGTLVKVQVVDLPNSVVLEGTQGSFVQGACNPNSVAVAQALNSAVGNPRASTLIAFLDDQPLNNLCGDFTLIAPEALASIFNAGVSLANVQTANLNRRMEDIRAGGTGFSSSGFALNGSAPNFSGGFAGVTGPEGKSGPPVMAPTPENRWGVWVTGIGEFANVDSTNDAAGYDIQSGGVTLGVDYRFTSYFAIGLTAGYANINADLPNGGSLDVNAGQLGLYATVFGSGFYADAAVTGGPSGYDSRRTALLGSANGNTDGGNFNVLIAAGYDWQKGGLSIGPTANFQYTYVGFSSFTESGSLAPLTFPSQNAESERTAFGMKASYDWKVGRVTIKPEISLAWQHEFGDQSYSIVSSFANGAGNSFTVNSPQVGRDSLLIGAGAAVLLSERISVYAYYDGQLLSTNYESNSVSAGVRMTF